MADRLAGAADGGRVDAHGELGRDPDRCLPADQRGFALGTNQIAGLAGMFVGLVAGGLLAAMASALRGRRPVAPRDTVQETGSSQPREPGAKPV